MISYVVSLYVQRGHKHTIFGYENPEMNNVQIGRTRTLDETDKQSKRLKLKIYDFLVIMTSLSLSLSCHHDKKQ